MRNAISTVLFLTVMCLPGESSAQPVNDKPPTTNKHFAKAVFEAEDGTKISYWLMSPATILKDKKYPLVLTLHGRGGHTAAATKLSSDAARERFPCFVMAPASTDQGHWAFPEGLESEAGKLKETKAMLPATIAAMDALVKHHPIDLSRIYVTGQSMGGVGTFGAVSARPDTFAAAIPVAGGWFPKDADKMIGTPFWVFHGDEDKTVPPDYSRSMVEAIKAAGGSLKYTEYKGVGHNSWVPAYRSDETWVWMFNQRRTD
ncbi:carboxylesterase family protein [Crateriforma spongiae]|uniref:carboxylesterase family protein n=1 Tax=Crateriforma spongiae TaxID=2724528 RepID=UPI0014450E30|nr:prolyl oligopeptidase family serine peptidase [Crateriforma spongiae]